MLHFYQSDSSIGVGFLNPRLRLAKQLGHGILLVKGVQVFASWRD